MLTLPLGFQVVAHNGKSYSSDCTSYKVAGRIECVYCLPDYMDISPIHYCRSRSRSIRKCPPQVVKLSQGTEKKINENFVSYGFS